MVNDRAALALSRIERALARIEKAAITQHRANQASVDHAELAHRHTALRHELQRTLGDSDQLIAQSRTLQG
jgi:predicted nucleic acid-binding protein